MFIDKKKLNEIKNKLTDEDYFTYIGDKYSYFKVQVNQGKIKFNWFALFFTIPWLIRHRLHKELIFICVSFILYRLGNTIGLIFDLDYIIHYSIVIAYSVLISIYIGIRANYIYIINVYKWYKKDQNKITISGKLMTFIELIVFFIFLIVLFLIEELGIYINSF